MRTLFLISGICVFLGAVHASPRVCVFDIGGTLKAKWSEKDHSQCSRGPKDAIQGCVKAGYTIAINTLQFPFDARAKFEQDQLRDPKIGPVPDSTLSNVHLFLPRVALPNVTGPDDRDARDYEPQTVSKGSDTPFRVR